MRTVTRGVAFAAALLLCIVCVRAQADIYDGTLQPFSYAELQATVTPSNTPTFIGSDALGHRPPEAFPFEVPAIPADMVPAGALQQQQANPYNAAQYAKFMATQRSGPTQPSLIERALRTAPSMIESRAAVYAPASPADNPVVNGNGNTETVQDGAEANDVLAAATQPIPDSGTMQEAPDARDGSMGNPMDQMADPMNAARFAAAPAQQVVRSAVSNSGSGTLSGSVGTASTSSLGGSASLSSAQPSASGSSMLPPLTGSSSIGSSGSPSSSGSLGSLASLSSSLSSLGSLSSLSSFSESSGASSMASSTSSSEPTPLPSPPKPLHRCVPTGNQKSCRIDFDPNTIPWKVVTVPRLDDGSSSTLASSSSSQSEESTIQEEYSSNPDIARAQKAYYAKLKELLKEKQWMAQVARIIDEYQVKIRNVNRHAQLNESELRKSRKNIVNMIKAEKQAKLQKELEAALESLKKLESTSQALNGKMTELSQTKMGLRATIQKIQRAVSSGAAATARLDTGTLIQMDDALKAPAAEEQTLSDRVAANESAKQLFSNLLELVSQNKEENQASSAQMLHNHAKSRIPIEEDEEKGHGQSSERDSDLTGISSRAAEIASKYAGEENRRLHTNLPLRTLAAMDYKKSGDDDLFLD